MCGVRVCVCVCVNKSLIAIEPASPSSVNVSEQVKVPMQSCVPHNDVPPLPSPLT